MDKRRQTIDQSALKFNQGAIMTLVLGGFILDQPILPTFVAIVMVLGSIRPDLALFKFTYKHFAKPLGLMKPRLVDDVPAPHEFAQLLGGLVLGTGAVLLYAGAPVAGWMLSWVVILLAAANLFLGFCAGCFVYYQLGRLGVRGFSPKEGRVS